MARVGFFAASCRGSIVAVAVAMGISFVMANALAQEATGKDAVAKTPVEPSVEDRYRALETFTRGLYYLETMYVDPDKVHQDQMIQHALKGIVDHLDPHTMFMPKSAFDQLAVDTQGKFGGVGIIVSEERGAKNGEWKLIVVSPMDDTPAMRAGIKSGDEITAIDGVPISQTRQQGSSDRLRGDAGTTVTLTVRRKTVKDTLTFKLTREIIKVRSVRTFAMAPGIHYVRISSFQDNTGDEFADYMTNKASKEPIKGIVIDLRDNPGGLLDQAVRVCDLFIESGVIVSMVGRDATKPEREFAHKRGTYTGFPIVVLVNGGSASASEIVAGAMQDHERAVIMGTTSFGKGSVQTPISLPDGSGMKITIARYYTPKDRSIQAKGITPDIVVPAESPVVVASDSKPAKGTIRKEADLAGHIESSDLSDLSRQPGVAEAVATWPEQFRGDNQVMTAFSYLRGWSMFGKTLGGGASESPPTKE